MTVSHDIMQNAMRTRALTLSVCTTGSISMSTTATTYVRATGSFIADGFAVGMEITPSGFTTSTVSVIIGPLTATTITVKGPLAVDAAGAGRTLTVGFPSLRTFENAALNTSDGLPVTGQPYAEENYLPGPSGQVTIGSNGQIEVTPMYSLKINVPIKTGISADGRYADALLDLFTPRTAITLSNGDILRVRTDVGPFRGQRLLASPGFSVIPITIPFRLRTANSI
jgi:hypothetical protein